MSKKVNIVFFHIGDQEYVTHTIRQIKSTNPDSTIHFIGDKLHDDVLKEVEFHHYEDLVCDQAFSFLKWFQNYSTNDGEFEKICILRWFCIRNLWKQKGFESIFYADCDVMVYCDLNEESKKFEKYLFSIAAGTAAHNTFINTVYVLEDFCNLVETFYCSPTKPLPLGDKVVNIKLYKENTVNEYKTRLTQGLSGGVSDMKFWQKLKLSYPAGAVGEMCEVRDGSTFDHTISECDGYEMEHGLKKLGLQNGFPMCYNRIVKDYVKFNTIHFQGIKLKQLMNECKTYE
ncbi:MAG TPA: hypothetical protein DEG69_01225 [Flavobacteriaceae bacterium]|nr:hypothetical protein [Flavobacteriaceae bacterium]